MENKYLTIQYKNLLNDIEGEITIDITLGQYFTLEQEVAYNQDIDVEEVEIIDWFITYSN